MAPKKPPGAKRGNSRKGTPPAPATETRLASHRSGPWGSQDFTDTLIVSTPPSPTEVANATPDATRAPAAATPTAAIPTVTLDPDLYVINTPPASRSGSRHPSPFTRSPLLRGPGHFDGEGYGFHRIAKAKKTDETTTMAVTTTPSAFTTPIVVGNLPEGTTEEMMMEDIKAATGIRVRAQAAGPSAPGPSASSTDGLNPDQIREHTAAREAHNAGLHSGPSGPTFTEEFEQKLAEQRLAEQFEEDRVQAEEDRRLLQNLNSPLRHLPKPKMNLMLNNHDLTNLLLNNDPPPNLLLNIAYKSTTDAVTIPLAMTSLSPSALRQPKVPGQLVSTQTRLTPRCSLQATTTTTLTHLPWRPLPRWSPHPHRC